MPSFRDAWLPKLDKIRAGIPSKFGIRQVELKVRVKTWSGGAVGKGGKTVTDTIIGGPGGTRYKIQSVTTKDILLSGGLYQAGQYKIGPITPPYPGGTYTADDIVPPTLPGQTREVYYGVTDATGTTQWCSMVGADTLNALHWYLFLKPEGPQDP